MTHFDSSWLVQRLTKPFKTSNPLLRDNPFSFGGGPRNGGLSDDAMGLIRDIFGFDYMGAAEFEWGAVPEALQRIAKVAAEGKLVGETMTLPNGEVYLITPSEWLSQVEQRVQELAKGDYGEGSYRLKESTRLSQALNGEPYTDRIGGWLELDNGFMFFTDKPMYEATADLLGVAR